LSRPAWKPPAAGPLPPHDLEAPDRQRPPPTVARPPDHLALGQTPDGYWETWCHAFSLEEAMHAARWAAGHNGYAAVLVARAENPAPAPDAPPAFADPWEAPPRDATAPTHAVLGRRRDGHWETCDLAFSPKAAAWEAWRAGLAYPYKARVLVTLSPLRRKDCAPLKPR
jgi:hypothetical protein